MKPIIKRVQHLFAANTTSSTTNSGMRIASADDLINKLHLHGDIRSLRQFTGMGDGVFNTYYQPVINRFIYAAQLCPSTTNLNHAYEGGLIVHSIGVTEHALRKRASINLPQGGCAERYNEEGPAWTYAVFVAAILANLYKLESHFHQRYENYEIRNILIEDDVTGQNYTIVADTNHSPTASYINTSALLFIPPAGITLLCKTNEIWNLTRETLFYAGANKNENLGGIIKQIVQQADRHVITNDPAYKERTTQTEKYYRDEDRYIDYIRSLFEKKYLSISSTNVATDAFVDNEYVYIKVSTLLVQLLSYYAKVKDPHYHQFINMSYDDLPEQIARDIFQPLLNCGLVVKKNDRYVNKLSITSQPSNKNAAVLPMKVITAVRYKLFFDDRYSNFAIPYKLEPYNSITPVASINNPTSTDGSPHSPPIPDEPSDKATDEPLNDRTTAPSDNQTEESSDNSTNTPTDENTHEKSQIQSDSMDETDDFDSLIDDDLVTPHSNETEDQSDIEKTFMRWMADKCNNNMSYINKPAAFIHCVDKHIAVVIPDAYKAWSTSHDMDDTISKLTIDQIDDAIKKNGPTIATTQRQIHNNLTGETVTCLFYPQDLLFQTGQSIEPSTVMSLRKQKTVKINKSEKESITTTS